jgi:ParB-like chromosome segregation protein Spo0J
MIQMILDGHRRKTLLEELGHTEINAIIREDLKGASDAAITDEFLRIIGAKH